jgi:hypothetical protein
MEMIDQSTPPPKQALFIHSCCGAGLKFLKAWIVANPGIKVKSHSSLNARDLGLHTKYGFDIKDLEKYVYLVFEDKIYKGDI